MITAVLRAREIALATTLAACGSGGSPAGGERDAAAVTDAATTSDAAPPDAAPCPTELDSDSDPPPAAKPCTERAYWPHALRAAGLPIAVHYARCADGDTARRVLALVEYAWRVETGPLGFTAPLADGGACGDDDAYDVFVWRGSAETYVEAFAPNPATPHDDWLSYMVVDPWGPYGGELLPSTIAHELNHACQAADDWWEHIAAFEMTATFVQELVYPDANQWLFVVDDFQTNPDWAIDRDDGYATWYMYGAALLLHFMRERYFAGDARFASAMWRASRNAAGDNEPDFEDALDDLLRARAGVGFAEAVGELAAWRWYTGERASAAHFADGALYPRPATVATVTGDDEIALRPMLYGSSYVDLEGTGQRRVRLLATPESGVRWLVQAVPGAGGTTSDVLDPTGDTVAIDGFAHRSIVVTVLPTTERDPDEQTDARHRATLVIAR